MIAPASRWWPKLRPLLVLGRVSNVPTVWSNCLAGWLLGAGGEWSGLAILCLGATLLYVGGMYLNDVFDVAFDRQHRPERPIPSGAISWTAACLWAIGWLACGTVLLVAASDAPSFLVLLLLACIIVYDGIHKAVTFSPALMAGCRLLLYLVAASVSRSGVTGLAMWSGIALALYVAGLSFLARKESVRGKLDYWPYFLLAAPILLALLVNNGEYRVRGVIFSLILALWIIRCLYQSVRDPNRYIGRSVSGLLAGIVLVDWLAVAHSPPWTGLVFIALFLFALTFQRVVPAT